jgi:hypothetical protein
MYNGASQEIALPIPSCGQLKSHTNKDKTMEKYEEVNVAASVSLLKRRKFSP